LAIAHFFAGQQIELNDADAQAKTPEFCLQVVASSIYIEVEICRELCRYEYRFENVLAAMAASMGESQIFVRFDFLSPMLKLFFKQFWQLGRPLSSYLLLPQSLQNLT